jgi:hypothetical protein
MTDEQMRDLVKECGLDWHFGYMPLFDGDPTNRYAVLIEAAVAAERERCAKLCETLYGEEDYWGDGPYFAEAIRREP